MRRRISAPWGVLTTRVSFAPSDGSVRWVHDRGYPIVDEAGNCRLRVGVASDITERKVMEEALRRHSKELSAANAELARAPG